MAWSRFQLFAFDQFPRRAHQWDPNAPAMLMKQRQRRLAKSATWLIVDSFKSQVVVRLRGATQIRQGVTDLCALVESRAANNPIGNACLEKPFFELAHLEGSSHQNRDLRQRQSTALRGFNFLPNQSRLFRTILYASNFRLLSKRRVGKKGLPKPISIVRDQP